MPPPIDFTPMPFFSSRTEAPLQLELRGAPGHVRASALRPAFFVLPKPV